MNYDELLLPPTSTRKQPLSYEGAAKEALEKAKRAYADFLVSQLVSIYNKTEREHTFAAWLLYSAKDLSVLAEGNDHEEYTLQSPKIIGMSINDLMLGDYIRSRFTELARIWGQTELLRLRFESNGFGRPLRITEQYNY